MGFFGGKRVLCCFERWFVAIKEVLTQSQYTDFILTPLKALSSSVVSHTSCLLLLREQPLRWIRASKANIHTSLSISKRFPSHPAEWYPPYNVHVSTRGLNTKKEVRTHKQLSEREGNTSLPLLYFSAKEVGMLTFVSYSEYLKKWTEILAV